MVEQHFENRRNATPFEADSTPLHIAIYRGHRDVAALLIRHGADINVKDHFGLTPFMICAVKSRADNNAVNVCWGIFFITEKEIPKQRKLSGVFCTAMIYCFV